jgi:hypothetical protein
MANEGEGLSNPCAHHQLPAVLEVAGEAAQPARCQHPHPPLQFRRLEHPLSLRRERHPALFPYPVSLAGSRSGIPRTELNLLGSEYRWPHFCLWRGNVARPKVMVALRDADLVESLVALAGQVSGGLGAELIPLRDGRGTVHIRSLTRPGACNRVRSRSVR